MVECKYSNNDSGPLCREERCQHTYRTGVISGPFKYIKATEVLSKYAKLVDIEDDDNNDIGGEHTRRDGDYVLSESSTIRRQKLQQSPGITGIEQRGHQDIDERNTTNNFITRSGVKHAEDRESNNNCALKDVSYFTRRRRARSLQWDRRTKLVNWMAT